MLVGSTDKNSLGGTRGLGLEVRTPVMETCRFFQFVVKLSLII